MLRRRTLVAYLMLLVLSACDRSPTDPPGDPVEEDDVVASLQISGDTVVATEQQRTLAAVARTRSGAVVKNAAPVWHSLDHDVATVSASGTVRAHLPGVARIVARVDTVADTLQLRVSAADLARGEMAGHIRSSSGVVGFRWSGLLQHREWLDAPARNLNGITGNQPVPGLRDSSLTVIMPGVAQVGTTHFVAYPLGGVTAAGPYAQLAVGTGPGDRQVYYGLAGGSIVIRRADFPARPGHLTGTATATVSFRATRYGVAPGGTPVPTADTIDVYFDMHVHLQHLIFSSATVQLQGAGPVLGTSLRAIGQTAPDAAGGILVGWDADFDGVAGIYPYEISQEFRLLNPAVGTFQLADITPEVWEGAPAQWPPAYSILGYRDDPRIGLSDDGTLFITEFILPTVDFYGVIRGTLLTTYELWLDTTQSSGARVSATASFAIPIAPLGGLPN